jgi:uncharacterized protein (TIGR03066 family)
VGWNCGELPQEVFMVRTLLLAGIVTVVLAPGRAAGPAEEVVGRWVSQDADKEPMVFAKDGKFECGFIRKEGKWVMAVGTYSVAADGTIQATATHGGAKLGMRMKLKDGVITRPRGPKLRVEYKKEKS